MYRYPYNPPLHIPNNVYDTKVWRIIKDFAIEFDQSWSINGPGNIYDLSEESSARGYLEKLLFDRAHHRNFDGLGNIWLIDKGAMWSRHPNQHYCTSDAEGLQEVPTPEHEIVAVYRGCDAEYLDVSLEQCSHKTADGMAPSSKGFVERLGLESNFVALPPLAQMRSSPKKDPAILARRSVEVGHVDWPQLSRLRERLKKAGRLLCLPVTIRGSIAPLGRTGRDFSTLKKLSDDRGLWQYAFMVIGTVFLCG
ncbi:hypothetical protein FOYG_15447 [Fusarium oxysporum NRRL 32931]|uniref:Uncharacterized protein n=1 Tax=Fusarium oxysporum NRRL 32931 TaxID=660029 RepID=W9HJQ6_FUSOX|nr:hypothetical protein FOYG_15447 [Fusarium oxysporum NRRL 32931]